MNINVSNPIQTAQLAAIGSAVLLAGAFVFEALGYAPCQMCLWQRYPHAIAIIVGLALIAFTNRWLIGLGAIATLTTAVTGIFHSGVEQKWWNGPSSCTGNGSGLSNLSGADLLNTDVIDKVVMCDQISWAFIGLSMPTWNAIFSIFLALIWTVALRSSKPAKLSSLN